MKIEHLGFEQPHHAAARRVLDLVDGLNVVDTRTPEAAYLLADLAGHVMYGARLRRSDQNVHDPAGYVDVASERGRFRLKRHEDRANRGTFTEPRLTAAPLDGQPACSDTIRELLRGMSAEIAARLMIIDTENSAQLDWLLSEELATQLCRLEQRASHACDETVNGQFASDRDLFSRRDRLSQEIEELLAEKRRSSEAIEAAVRELEIESQSVRTKLVESRRELDRVLSELAEIETQLRYDQLADYVGRATEEAHHANQQPVLDELDGEIARWRQALADLEARDAKIRAELSQARPDEASPLLPLADQRAAVAISQRLVADLDSEVARFARPSDSPDCLCRHAHTRLHPLVDTLGQQVEKLTGLVSQYETAIHLQQLKTESQHLARSQAEIRATVDHLLDRRQERLRVSRSRPAAPLTESASHDVPARQLELEQRRAELADMIRQLERRLSDSDSRREQLRGERAELMNDRTLTRLRHELDDVTRLLNQGPAEAGSGRKLSSPWRASDILSKLTDGRLREVQLSQGGRLATITDQHGEVVRHTELDNVDCQLVVLSLQLAAVAGAAQWGANLPLVIADPFSSLPAAEASVLALVLQDFARAGHQVVVFTASRVALERLRAIGHSILPLPTSSPEPPESCTVQLPTTPSPQESSTEERAGFVLGVDDSIDRFAVFGNETGPVFQAIGIRSVGDLLRANADELSHALDRTGISSSIVQLWQTHLAFMVFVPNLSLDDAQLLTGANVRTLEQLAQQDAEALHRAICEYLESPRGVRHRALLSGFTRQRAATWIAGARRERERWQSSAYRPKHFHANGSGNARPYRNSNRKRQNGAAARGKRLGTGKAKRRPLRFRLSRTSPVVDAPSIGPKTAKRLRRLGIDTVDQLLTADAAETAGSLKSRHVSAETVVEWQHQAQLMCRVPELLARDTQVLVGCGFTTPEDIAAAEASDLLEFAKSYTSTPEGTRILRGSDPPDLARVNKWIYWAGQRRALEAA